RTFNLNTATQQPRLAVNLMTCERTVAATHAQIHIHHQEICAVNDSSCNLLFSGRQHLKIRIGLNRFRKVVNWITKTREQLRQFIPQALICCEVGKWHLECFCSRHQASCEFPPLRFCNAFKAKTIACSEKIDPDRLPKPHYDFGRRRIDWNPVRSSNPTALKEHNAVYWRALLAQAVAHAR